MIVTDEILAQYYEDFTHTAFGCDTGSVQAVGSTFNPLNPISEAEASTIIAEINQEEDSLLIPEAHYYTGSLGEPKLQLAIGPYWVDLETGETSDPETGDSYTSENGYAQNLFVIGGYGEVGNSCKCYMYRGPLEQEPEG